MPSLQGTSTCVLDGFPPETGDEMILKGPETGDEAPLSLIASKLCTPIVGRAPALQSKRITSRYSRVFLSDPPSGGSSPQIDHQLWFSAKILNEICLVIIFNDAISRLVDLIFFRSAR